MKIRRVLVANRGEIAVRILRTCQRLGIDTVLAASAADLDSVPARIADRTLCVGPATATQSYLNIEALVTTACAAQVDAVHPGYGFLAENATFARRCAQAGIEFIGPTEAQLVAMGDKLRAREHAIAAGLPVLPGGPITSASEAVALAQTLGWPVLIKAVGGGGGRGLRAVRNPAELTAACELSTAEARAAFGDPRLYLERLVERGRHIEVQILGDGRRVLHLGERECSIQRRYQKLLEEAPAPALDRGVRDAMHAAAVALGRHLGYRGLGTVEFLFDVGRGEFYFLEMNARIQVEHPVTEAITGLDLVAEQIAVAEHRPLELTQDEVACNGHAIECRILAEDPARDFRPSPGKVGRAVFPAGFGIRVDTHVESGTRIPPFYDSLMAKVIANGADRAAAITCMQSALARCQLDGVANNIALHAAILADARFRRGAVDTGYLARFLH